jgi:hypothetical protein
MWRLRPPVLAGALWAVVALILIRRDLRGQGVQASVISTFGLSKGKRASAGVAGALARLHPSCLEEVLILQKWRAALGDHRDVIVGVPKSGFTNQTAHAWLVGAESGELYIPIHTFRAP